LLAPAPPAGATVKLTSSNPAVASLPATVKLAPGATASSAFKITTSPVTVSTPVSLTAAYNGIAVQATLTVNPLEPASLTLGQSAVTGGKTVSGNSVELNGAAPAGGVTVSLASSNPAVAAVPATVTVTAGSRLSPKFSIATMAVAKQTAVTITATYQGNTASATLTVKP
jgi:methionine-rich copper-binding protein CopC